MVFTEGASLMTFANILRIAASGYTLLNNSFVFRKPRGGIGLQANQ